MFFNAEVWSERGVFVNGGDRWVGLMAEAQGNQHAQKSCLHSAMAQGVLELREAFEVAYMAAPVMGPNGDAAAFKRVLDVAAPLLTTSPQIVMVRPNSILMMQDLSPSDRNFWLKAVAQAYENLTNIQRAKASNIVVPPPRGFNSGRLP